VILQLAAQYTWGEEKRRHLRGISTAGHIAVAGRGCNGTLYEIVTTDCEAKLVIILRLKVDQLIATTIKHTALDTVLQPGKLKALG
jgi:hypothetical protein